MPTLKKSENIFLMMHPLHRILISFAFSFITYFSIKESDLNPLIQWMLLWDVFALVYIINCWIVFFKSPTSRIRQIAQKEDGSRVFVFMIILISSFASMFTVLLLILSKEAAKTAGASYIITAIAGMLLSWFMVHTIFAFHYAHMFYSNDDVDPKKHEGGLDFPGDEKPDYLDFAYFSFVVGMTFQVSDVEITSRHLRRQALVHGLLSFILNTFVVALTINLIAGLKK